MSKLTVIVVLVAVAVAGLARLAAQRAGVKKKRRFAETFLARFRSLAHGDGSDEETYAWLVARSARMQERLGVMGLAAYQSTSPYDLTSMPADPLIVNTLPELRGGYPRPERVAQCEEAIMRYLGTLDDERTAFTKSFVNPVIWLGEGVRAALLLPFLTLQWLGLFKETFINRLDRSAGFSLLSGLVAVVGLAASVMIIALGWEPFTDLTQSWIGLAWR